VSKTDLEKFNVFGDKDDYILQAKAHFLVRGDVNRKQEIATQIFPRVLTRGATRDNPWAGVVEESVPLHVALANWITDVDHDGGALLARVIVK